MVERKNGGSETGKGTTPAQRRRLIAAYQRGGNMTAAMQEVGIRSPRTAYLWWHRFQQQGEAGLIPRSRARKTQKTVPDEIAAQVCALRRGNPDWGRRRIARELATRHGASIVSPSGVEEVLRRAGLWVAADRPAPESAPAPIGAGRRVAIPDLDDLISRALEGIDLSLQCRSREAVAMLDGKVWSRLEGDRHAWFALLDDPAVGDLFLRSRVQLGHSLMSVGQWRRAWLHLEETIGWLGRGTGDCDESTWQGPPLGVSLRRDDAWVECYQYLGIVLRDRDPALARSRVATVLAGIRSTSTGRLVPTNAELAAGNLERDLAKLLMRAGGVADGEVEAHLRVSRTSLEETGDHAMLAATDMAWADLHAARAAAVRGDDRPAWRHALDAMEAAVGRALVAIERLDSPLLQTDFFVDATRLSLAHGIPIDETRLRKAAAQTLTNGYGGQARQLLDLPGVDRFLPEEEFARLEILVADRPAPGIARR
jgi:transposase